MSYIMFRLDPTVVDITLDQVVEDLPELPKEVRIDLAHQAWRDEKGKLSIPKAARQFGVAIQRYMIRFMVLFQRP